MRSKTKTFYWRQSHSNCFQYKFYINSQPQIIQWARQLHLGLVLRKGESIASATIDGKEDILKIPFSGKVIELYQTKQGTNLLLFVFQKCEHVPIQMDSKIETCGICGDELFSYQAKEEIEYRKWDFKQIKNMEAPIQWNVVLNQQFTHGKVLGCCGEEELILDFTGRVVYLDNPKDRNLPILKVRKTICLHQRVKDNICLQCNAVVQFQKTSITVQTNGIINTGRLLQKLQTQFVNKLKSQKKLILILDLDNTIVHAVNTFFGDTIDFQVKDCLVVKSEFVQYIIKIRPFMREFLQQVLPLFDIYIYTKGTRIYAEKICQHIRQKYQDLLKSSEYDDYFTPKRITSRDEDTSLTKKSLENIIKGHEGLILILDDRKDVWEQCRKNVITTKQYLYYQRQQNRVFILPHPDYYLHLATPFILNIHKLFYQSPDDNNTKDVRNIIKILQKQRFSTIKAYFMQTDLRKYPSYIRAINMGMTDVGDWNKSLPDLFIYSPNYVHKDYQQILETKKPLVHQVWIEYCHLHNFPFKWEMFEITHGDFISGKGSSQKAQFQRKLFEAHKLYPSATLQQ